MCPPCLGAAPPSPSTCVAVPRSGAGVAGHSRCLHSVLRLQSTHTGTAGAASVGYGGRCQCPDSCTPSQGPAACRVEHRPQRIIPRQWRSERQIRQHGQRLWLHMFRYMVSHICFATWSAFIATWQSSIATCACSDSTAFLSSHPAHTHDGSN